MCKIKKTTLLLIGICFSLFLPVFGQDSQIAMYTASPLAINPASTGYFKNDLWRVYVNHREQWSGAMKLRTSNFSYDMPLKSKKIGIGFFTKSNYAGSLHMSTFTGMFSVSYNTKLMRQGGHYLSFGAQMGIKQNSFDAGNQDIKWNSMYVDGAGFDKDLTSGESFGGQDIINPDFNFGVLWYVNDPWKNFLPWFGVSAFHLSEPQTSFMEKKMLEALQRKFYVNTGADIIFSKNLAITPTVLIAKQVDPLPIQYNIGSSVKLTNYKNKKATSIYLGSFYRDHNAIAALVAFEFNHFTFMFNYEINTIKNLSAVNGVGGLEVTLKYVKTSKKSRNVKFM